ncbi:hypothetical protein BDY19DRAFT_955511 [Irpex rosettiformis]|uniref:Uncharacterized protein n=1 Tax=Irpex rosettiformis TaxID=378272 RepID=A0ACB8TZ81_9APHY|nr:hypothetical protein BDY19DRAFT_955511 [Irpex rosettiformis]
MTIGEHLSEKWHKFCDDRLECAFDFHLPLPGEFIVVEIDPNAILCKINNPEAPKLVNDIQQFPYKKYCAIVYKYLTALAPTQTWWHSCLLLVLCSTSTGSVHDSINMEDVLKRDPSTLRDCEWIVVPSRLCTPAMRSLRYEVSTTRITPETLEEIFTKAISNKHEGGIVLCQSGKFGDEGSTSTLDTLVPGTGSSSTILVPECGDDKHSVPISVDHDELAQIRKVARPAQKHWLLWPHLGYDLNAHGPVSSGSHFLAEHSSTLRLLDDHWLTIPQISGIVAKAEEVLCPPGPRPGLTFEGIRYRHHYMKSKESHIVVISADRMDSRRFTAIIIPGNSECCISKSDAHIDRICSDYTMSSSKKLRTFLSSLTSVSKSRAKKDMHGVTDFVEWSMQNTVLL